MKVARERASNDPSHDFLHIDRVYRNAQFILQNEQADEEIVLVSVLLHELLNYPKGHPNSKHSGDICAEHAHPILIEFSFPEKKIPIVLDCIRNHSFSKGMTPVHLEGKIVQDADRLDSIGAIGIARCFASCSQMERPFYNELDPFAHNRYLVIKNLD